jgi:hypothetical protein
MNKYYYSQYLEGPKSFMNVNNAPESFGDDAEIH